MSVEGREPQQADAVYGQKLQPPSSSRFQTKVSALIARAKRIRSKPLRTLAHSMDEDWLQESWKRLRKGAACGIDKVTANDYAANLHENLKQLRIKLSLKKYKAPPVKRVFIPKATGEKRPLGLPTTEDKVAQNAVGLILSAVYEQEFLPTSYGFRPNRNAHQAIGGVRDAIALGKVSWVLDADIKSFFDALSHDWLMKFISHRVADKRIQHLIRGWLKAGVMKDGELERPASGSPQGGVISPILANIYLHYVLDLWVDKIVRPLMKGEMHNFRYADDILFCFQYRQDALRFQKGLIKRMNKFGLNLNEMKTKLCRFGKFSQKDARSRGERRATFNFLGFTFYNDVSRNGKYKVGCRTQSTRLSSAMSRITQWCKENRHQAVEWQARYLNAMLRGHYNYYGVTGNFLNVAAMYRHTRTIWRRYLSKRSQRAYLSWERYLKVLADHPLLKPYLPHSIYRKALV